MKLDKSLKNLTLSLLTIPTILLILGVLDGLLQVLFRAGWIRNTEALGIEYYQGLTLHGVINAIVFTTFFAVAFGNAVVSYALRKPLNMKIAWLSFWLMLVGVLCAAYAMLTGQASVLYTFYPPMKAHPLFYLGLALAVVGSWIAFWNWIPLYLQWRRENTDRKTPLAVVGIFSTFTVWQIATIPVAIEVLFMLLPWSLNWTNEINVMLARTLFWFFGHPLVYFWLLPAYVMYYTMLPKLTGGKLYSDLAGRLVFMLFIVFSIPVGTHHQYADPGIGSEWKFLHAVFTFAVALPSLITAFTVAASLEYAGRKNGGTGLFGWIGKLPWFQKDRWLVPYLLLGLIIFIFGGISGIVNASYNLNLLVHNTSWIPGHFHLTVAGPVFLAFLGMTLYMLSTMSGKPLRLKGLATLVPYLWTIGLFIFSFGMMRGGLHGEPRRTNLGLTYLNPESPLYRPEWEPYVVITAIGGIIMFVTMVIYFVVFFSTLLSSKQEEEQLEFPLSEAYHDAPVRLLANFKPWVTTAIILILIAYIPVLYDVLRSTQRSAPPYDPRNPAPLVQPEAAGKSVLPAPDKPISPPSEEHQNTQSDATAVPAEMTENR